MKEQPKKGETKRSEVLPIRTEKDFKLLLSKIANERAARGLRFHTMTDVITAAVKEYALNHYSDIYNEVYKQSSI